MGRASRSARSFEIFRVGRFQESARGAKCPVADADHTCSRNRNPPDARIAIARANSSSGAASGSTPCSFNSAKRSRPVFNPLHAAMRYGAHGSVRASIEKDKE